MFRSLKAKYSRNMYFYTISETADDAEENPASESVYKIMI